MSPASQPDDVRMRGFARRATVDEVLEWLDRQVAPLDTKTVDLADAPGRVLAGEVVSDRDVPAFDRSMMDGFALKAADTIGASPYNRLAIDVVGQSMPGQPFQGNVTPGKAVRIMTGAPLPDGADAVLPVEKTDIDEACQQLYAQADVSPGKNVGRIGEDIAEGTAVLPPGRVLRPQDIGVLASIGRADVPVVRRPRVRIVVTGNELLPVGSLPEPHKIVDSNGPMLAALIARDGGLPDHPGIVPDPPDAILEALRDEADVVVVSGGSSVGQEDYAPALLIEHGELPIHGIAMRPSSPTGIGRMVNAQGKPRLVFLLPGNPVSCLCAYDFFAGRAIRKLGGRAGDWPYRCVTRRLARKIVSTVGRLDYLRVRLEADRVEPLAIGGASVLSSTTRADGFVLVPPDAEGYPPGAEVSVYLYD